MNPRHPLLLGLLSAVLWAPLKVAAHGDLHESIEALTQKIATQQGADAATYLQRGEFYRLHKDWAPALADFDRAQALDPRLGSVDFCRGRLLLESGNLPAALQALDRFLGRYPLHGEARSTRAVVFQKLGKNTEAAEDLRFALEQESDPRPEHFLDYAALLKRMDQDSEALAVLDKGIERLGALVTLELPAIELELRLRRTEAALARVDRLAAGGGRREMWLLRRGEILAQAGRPQEARQALEAAGAAARTLPDHRRNTLGQRELEARIKAALEGLAKP